MPSLPLRPALAPRDGISSFASIQSSDSYYSNEEIAILHDVVTAAQDNLDLLPEGERLATNALFQAYDAVLPNYGVDPEEDHHISRLVFRVGGERGDGSLLDKLRNVLARMGIELEFDSRSEGSRPFSDPGDERDHEIPLQRSPQSNSEHNSATTDDDSSEHIQLPQQGRSRPIPAPDEAVRNGDRANLQRLMPTLPRPSHLAPELSERLEHLSQSHSPSTAAGTEPSHQSLRSVAGSNEHRGASDTTIQPVETVAHNAGKNVSIATSLPVRSKSVRTVNWLLPEDVGARPIIDGQETSRAEQNIHYEPFQPRSEQYLPRKEQLPFYPNQNTSHDQYPLYEQPQQYLPQQGNLHLEQPVAQNDVHHLQHEQFQHYTLPQQSSAPQNQQQPQQRRQQLHIDETPGNEVSGRHSNISTAVQHETGKRPSIDTKVLGQESSSIERHKVQQQQQQIAPVPPKEPSGDNVLFNRQAAPPDEQLEGDPAMDARYAWLGKRAARAARYLQILRGISHWETYAAEKRERTAVARRHILRMRHFDPWELVTADAKLKGRRIFTSRLLTLWARWADDGVVMEQRVVTIAARRLADGVLTAWQHVKATSTKEYLIRWKSLARVHRNLGWEATKHLSMEKRDRVVGFLDVWYKESSRDRGASRLLTAAWLGEWHIISQEHTSMHGRSKEVWQETLKMRYWGQWQSTVLQLKSREYVATDVRERNKKQLVRRLLHHWKGDGDMARSQHFSAMRASLGSSRKGTGLGISRQSLQLSRTVHERPGTGLFRASNPQEMGPPVEEEEDQDGGGSAADADGIVVSTPTRWTGMASSVQLPSMTPFAPLPTPFERELRERYNRSVPPAQAGQLSRLSLAQAQRLSTADVYITGSAFTVLCDPDTIVQTVYDEDPAHLQAVAFDEWSGKIATCTDCVVRVYKPFGQSEDALKWGLQSSFLIPDFRDTTDNTILSWGTSEELLVAHSVLRMYSTADEPISIWTKSLPNPSKLAEISYDSAYIASVGFQDRLVKVWRRLTYGAEDVRFDLAYLRHPDVVTGRFVIFLEHNTICLWDCRLQKAVLLERQSYEIAGKPLCLVILPRQPLEEYAVAHIATVTSEQQGLVWKVNLPWYSRRGSETCVNGRDEGSIQEYCRFQLDDIEGLAYVLPVDPAGSAPVTSGFLDVFARDIAISYTHSGRVDFWTARVDHTGDRVGWLSTCSAETGLSEPALVSGSTLKKAALVDSTRSQLSIWDIGAARLEFTQNYGTNNVIQDLDWTSTPDSQSILAVGFQSKVVLLCQMRFDYLNKGPAWAAVREISIRELTPHPIGDSTWLGDGHLVIGSGNQMFVHGREYDLSGSLVKSLQLPHRKNGVWDLFEAVQRFNGPLPVFHPQFLSQSILAGKSTAVRKVLMSLYKTLKFHVAGEPIDDYLGLDPAEFYQDEASAMHASGSQLGSHFDYQAAADEEEDNFTEDVAYAINERLTKVDIEQLSGHEQIQLADIVECVGLVEKQRRSLDENGARFMLFFRQHALRKGRTSEIQMSWREINWAYHSTSQDILIDFVTKQCHGGVRWEDAKESGMFMWLSDHNALRAQFENVARNEYTKSDAKNPVDCSLYYLALKKKTVLQGLWRMAYGNREQATTQRFLGNNFDDPVWRTKALKNAYALLSKRRFEYAAAFFLLADHLQDAVNVCLNQLRDLQRAVAIARVYEGDQGPVLRKLLEEEVLSLAAREGNRWLASWTFWMLNRKDMAVRALISPVYTLIETPCTPDMQSKLFLTDDPALVVLYAQLRQKTLQTLRGASKVTPRVEWEFVLHSAKLYDRMGCDLLGLDLVRNWEFLKPAISTLNGLGGEINPLKLLRRHSSLVVADLPMLTLNVEMRSSVNGSKDSAPTVFQEPDSSSLLDSFGF
ncbi:WD repeat protein [Colletotrichum camelliae]|nr:WD repeat protein [Colletotrichum camelliae]